MENPLVSHLEFLKYNTLFYNGNTFKNVTFYREEINKYVYKGIV